jgi:hypothetical protein
MRSSANLDLHDPEPFSGRVFDAHLDPEFGRKQKPTAWARFDIRASGGVLDALPTHAGPGGR